MSKNFIIYMISLTFGVILLDFRTFYGVLALLVAYSVWMKE